MEWIMLLLAALFEVTWAVTHEDVGRLYKGAAECCHRCRLYCIALFLLALKKLPRYGVCHVDGLRYCWTSVLGVVLLHEGFHTASLCVVLIVGGIVGLKVLS